MAQKRQLKNQLDASTTTTHSSKKSSSSVARRKAARAARERRRRLQKYAIVAFGVVAIGFLVILIGSRILFQPGDQVVSQGNLHVSEAQVDSFDYNSRPPTSGPHLESRLVWGIYDKPVSEGRQIHNLEDGGVAIWYDCPEGCPELVIQLERLAYNLGEEGLILAPYPDMETRIAVTAWNRVDRMEALDEKRITEFVNSYRGIDHH